ncbi:protein cordon-bleu isoform X2 [Esox lucius]|uniref:protein cordon-bleu isoform X2 n=1 Tax=Esox lucius TaxID=8010 RepID=UPI001477251C|nr:protein cordon-bleu isoform X2 [Esox lucius]
MLSKPHRGSMNEKESPLEKEHILTVLLPGGLEKRTTVHGSTPVMDLLVSLCAQYHLNPSDFTVELQSANRNDIACKPSSLIGAMEADRIILKPKGVEEKIRKPYVPEATVRLLVNYKKNHKAVVRVNPRVPLQRLLPTICEKCEFDLESTILLKNNSEEPLDLTKSLNDYGLRELHAKEAAVVSPAVSLEVVITPPPPEAQAAENSSLPDKGKKQKENKGLFSLFRRIKKKPDKVTFFLLFYSLALLLQSTVIYKHVGIDDTQHDCRLSLLGQARLECVFKMLACPDKALHFAVGSLLQGVSGSAPASPGLKNHRVTSVSMNSLGGPSNTLPAKKRRAPQPPLASSRSVPANLNIQPPTSRKKKRAPPPPPCANTRNRPLQGPEVKGNEVSLYTVEEEVGESQGQDSPSSASSENSPSPLTQPRFPSSSSPTTLRPFNPYPTSPPPPTSVAETLTPFLLCQTRAKLKHPSPSSPREVNSVVGGPPGSSTRPQGLQEVSPLHLLQLRAKVLGGAWRNPGQREGMTTFTVVPRAQTPRRQQGPGADLTLGKTSEPPQTVDETHNGVPDPEWEDQQSVNEWSEVEGPGLKPNMKSKCSPLRTPEGSPLRTPEESTGRVLSPHGLSRSVELHQTETNSPVEPHGAESLSPIHAEESPDSGVQVQEDLESLSEVSNPYGTVLFAHTGDTPGNEMISPPQPESRRSFQEPSPMLEEDKEGEEDRFCFPPPPPPLCHNKEGEETHATQPIVRLPGGRNPSPPSYPPPHSPLLSPTSSVPAEGDDLTNFPSLTKPNMIRLTLPTPYVPPGASGSLARKTAISSCFAQAVASAVRRAQSSAPRRPTADPVPPSGSSHSSAVPLSNTGSE